MLAKQNIADIQMKAVREVIDSCALLGEKDPGAYEKLMYGLILSGLAMQLTGNSRPASGSEHHMSHLWEMCCINEDSDALHGEKVGVGLLYVLREYHRYLNTMDADAIAAIDLAKVFDRSHIEKAYGSLPCLFWVERFGLF